MTETGADGGPGTHPGDMLSYVQAGVIGGLLAIIFAISHASLVTGSVAPQATATVVGMALIGTAVLCAVSALLGQVRGAVSMSQDVPAAALGSLLLGLSTARVAAGGGLSIADIVVLNAAAAALFAVALFLLGSLRLSAITRYAPRPVLSGFLAGTGYFVVVGALGICLGSALTWESVTGFLAPPARDKLLVALAVTGALAAATRVLPSSMAIGGVIATAVLVFHLGAYLLGAGPAHLLAQGWVIAVPEAGLTWPPVPYADLANVEVSGLLALAVPLATSVVLTVTAVLMMTTAIEAATKADLNLDKEMQAVGAGNCLCALLGGMPGYPGVAATLAARRVAPGHRVVSVVVSLLALAVFGWGNVILAALPLPVFAGFLIWVGADFLREFLIDERRRTTRGGAGLTVAIFAVIVVFGLFEGTIFGLIVGGMLFVVDYSRQPPVRSTLFGDAYHGAHEYSPAELRVLQDHGGEIAILKMQGYVFFGTAHRIRAEIRTLMATHGVRGLVLDFDGVTAVDGTAIASFRRIADDLADHGATACLSGVAPDIASVFARAGLATGPGTPFAMAEDLETALSGFLSGILRRELGGAADRPAPIQTALADILQDPTLAAQIAGHLDRVAVAPGETVATAGEAASDMYVVETGHLAVSIGRGAAERRLRVMGPGSIVGEISYYAGGVRTSDVRALDQAVLWRFSAATAARILQDDPDLSSRFHAALARSLAHRVVANTRLIQMLRD